MTVAELLAASRTAHAAYRQLHAQAAQAKQKKPNGWQVHLWDALVMLRRADELDPWHVDPAWHIDGRHHGALMAFYEQQLGLST